MLTPPYRQGWFQDPLTDSTLVSFLLLSQSTWDNQLKKEEFILVTLSEVELFVPINWLCHSGSTAPQNIMVEAHGRGLFSPCGSQQANREKEERASSHYSLPTRSPSDLTSLHKTLPPKGATDLQTTPEDGDKALNTWALAETQDPNYSRHPNLWTLSYLKYKK